MPVADAERFATGETVQRLGAGRGGEGHRGEDQSRAHGHGPDA